VSAAQNILAWILCAAFFGALGFALYLAPGWGAVLGDLWISAIEVAQ